MIALAQEVEDREPLGCRYLHTDAGKVNLNTTFDIVSAAYLLCYAKTRDELTHFCRMAFNALRPGGRFVGFNDNVNRDPNEAPSFAPYGFEKRCPPVPKEGDEIIYAIRQPEGGTFEITNFYLSPQTYADAFSAAGFANFEWRGPWLAPDQANDPYWESFMLHAPLIGFSAERP